VTGTELVKGRVCVDYIQGQIFKLNGKFHKCDNNEWIAVEDKDTTGIMKDLAGKTYKTVVIGSQLWMKENMSYKTDSSYCYENNENYCTQHGRLYAWNSAMKVCPTGWRLPSMADWNILISLAESGSTQTGSNAGMAGRYLKSKSGWYQPDVRPSNGSDLFNFTVLPSGYRDYNTSFDLLTKYAFFWTSTEHQYDRVYVLYVYYSKDNTSFESDSKTYGYSVRCIQDD